MMLWIVVIGMSAGPSCGCCGAEAGARRLYATTRLGRYESSVGNLEVAEICICIPHKHREIVAA